MRAREGDLGYTAFDRFVARQRFRVAAAHVRRGSRVCDMGCGSGAPLLDLLGPKIAFGVGVDVLVERRPSWGGVALVRADLSAGLPLADNSFDHVVLLAVLEHLAAPGRVFGEALRLLRPGGTLIMTWPSAAVDPILAVLTRVGIVRDELGFDQHQPRVPPRMLRATLEAAGFVEVRHGRFELGLNNWLVARRPSAKLP